MNKIIQTNFKEMSWLLKILFIMSVFTLITSLIDISLSKPVNFSYFDSGFPQNFPIAWHVYSVLLAAFTVYVFIKRSFSLMVKFILFSAVMLVVSAINSLYYVMHLSDQNQIIFASVAYIIGFAIAALFLAYYYSQKKYFNKP